MSNECIFLKVEVMSYNVVKRENGIYIEYAGLVEVRKCQHMYRTGRPSVGGAVVVVGDNLSEVFGIDYRVPGARENHPISTGT